MDDIWLKITPLLDSQELHTLCQVNHYLSSIATPILYASIPPIRHKYLNTSLDDSKWASLCKTLQTTNHGSFIKYITFNDDSFKFKNKTEFYDLESIRKSTICILQHSVNLKTLVLGDILIGDFNWLTDQILDAIPASITNFTLKSKLSLTRQTMDSSYPDLNLLSIDIMSDDGLIRLFRRTRITHFTIALNSSSTITPYGFLLCLKESVLTHLRIDVSCSWADEDIEGEFEGLSVVQSLTSWIQSSQLVSFTWVGYIYMDVNLKDDLVLKDALRGVKSMQEFILDDFTGFNLFED